TNGTLQLSWPADHTGWELEAQTNATGVGLSTNWTLLSLQGPTNSVIVPLVATNGSVFYRLIYP
ncbi:MAG: hypothetical protein ACRED1_06845, partial [Limisphaerales bacterium]